VRSSIGRLLQDVTGLHGFQLLLAAVGIFAAVFALAYYLGPLGLKSKKRKVPNGSSRQIR
jgi:hypothetical protein